MTVLDAGGRAMELRAKLGEGGEGAVWRSPRDPSRVVKVYARPMTPVRAEKLAAMTALGDAALLDAAAWPTRVVYDPRSVPVGFEMPDLSGHAPLHELFGTKGRLKAFPTANWALLAHAAANLAAAFAGLHARGIVVGDVNSNNVVVAPDGRVRFLDCDSFQIATGRRVFRCEVGVPEYQPPELQGVALGSLDRTPAHDAFGMAVMIFQLLFVGKHPFMGRLPDPGSNPPTIGENVARGHYFYDETARRAGLLPPPASLTLGAVTPVVAGLFAAAFRGSPAERPTALAWRAALVEMGASIAACRLTPAHRHLAGQACPWCAIETQANIVYFAAPGLASPAGEIDESIWQTFPDAEVERLWLAIARIRQPAVAYDVPPEIPAVAAPIGRTLRRRARTYYAALAVSAVAMVALFARHALSVAEVGDGVLAACIALFGRPSGGAEKAAREARLREADERFALASRRSRELCEAREFHARRERLEGLRATLLAQGETYRAECARAEASERDRARSRYLDRFSIARANLKGIGSGLAARLASWNIETACDVDARVSAVPGVGRRKAERLFAWRAELEGRFRFDRESAAPALREVRVRHARHRAQGRDALIHGSRELATIAERIEAQAPAARAEAIRSRRLLDQAEADVRPFRRSIFR